jgi:hypothetical protein
MGQGSSIQLDKGMDGCQLSSITKNVVGLKSNSASPSDTWIIEAKDNVFYDGEKIDKIFMKYFINPEYLISLLPDPQNITLSQEDVLKFTMGLRYELELYKQVVRPLIDYGVCDNFVKYLGSGMNCPYQSLVSALNFNGKEYNIQRNIAHMANLKSGRPAITDTLNTRIPYQMDFRVDSRNANYMFILNEAIKPGTHTLHEYLARNNYLIPECVLFQFVYACYAMYTSKLAHNDLHNGNCYLERLSYPETMTYVYGEQRTTCSFKCEYMVKIYDFDRGYHEKFPDNPLNDADYCQKYGTCNEVVQLKDIWKFFGTLYSKTNNDTYLNLFCKDASKHALLRACFKDPDTFWYKYQNKPLTKDNFEYFGTYEDVLDNIVALLNSQGKVTQNIGKINQCRPSMFKDGVLIADEKKASEDELEKTREVYRTLEEKCKRDIDECKKENAQLKKQINFQTLQLSQLQAMLRK